MKPKTNGHKHRTSPEPDAHPMEITANWLKSEEQKEKEAQIFNKRNRYLLVFAICALYMLISLTIANTTDSETVIVFVTFGTAWLAGWECRKILQERPDKW